MSHSFSLSRAIREGTWELEVVLFLPVDVSSLVLRRKDLNKNAG